MTGKPDEPQTASPRAVRCPICGKPAEQATRPFCSRRCADIDLARWLGGTYVIAGGNADADEDGEAGLGDLPPVSQVPDKDAESR